MQRRRMLRSPVVGVALILCSLAFAALTVRAYLDDSQTGLIAMLRGSPTPVERAVIDATRETDGGTPTPSPTPSPTPVPTRFAEEPPLSARAAIVVDADTGAVLYERNADEPLPPASTTKIVTALTVLRHARPEEVVTIQPEDVVDPNLESNMQLQAGDTVTVHDLLVGLLLPSGNDAARALARFVGERLPGEPAPPVERFVAEMNAVAADLGMSSTHLVQPSGDDAEGQVVTARDLALAARALIAEPALLPIVAMPQAEVRVGGPHARVIRLSNTNELLAEEGVYGIKTGTTELAAQCLVVAYRAGGHHEIAVILGSQDRYTDARTLLRIPQPGR